MGPRFVMIPLSQAAASLCPGERVFYRVAACGYHMPSGSDRYSAFGTGLDIVNRVMHEGLQADGFLEVARRQRRIAGLSRERLASAHVGHAVSFADSAPRSTAAGAYPPRATPHPTSASYPSSAIVSL